ncbi:MAG: succinate dehydrogenase iron-sulfur subunit, partial [Deltaproteobacteria bacterium]|nr:succinate dehydrogenase iron-sulfur subunit [Deltaproteobacteria bacterium]
GSLAFRSSCRAGVCGSCAMHINGKYGLACETQLLSLPDTAVVRPLAHLRIIKDLLADMSPFWAKYKYIKPYLISDSPAGGRERHQSMADRIHLDTIIDCILCAACYSACPITDSDEDYLGPAILMKANRFVVDTRDAHSDERLALVGDDHGIFRCHTAFNCTEACPKNLDPAGSIAHMKRKFIARKLFRFKRQ